MPFHVVDSGKRVGRCNVNDVFLLIGHQTSLTNLLTHSLHKFGEIIAIWCNSQIDVFGICHIFGYNCYLHTQGRAQGHGHTYRQTHACTQHKTHIYAHTRTYAHTYAVTNIQNKHTHTNKHIHKNTHARTHTHTYTPLLSFRAYVIVSQVVLGIQYL